MKMELESKQTNKSIYTIYLIKNLYERYSWRIVKI